MDRITSPNLQDDDYGLLLDFVELVNRNPSSNVVEALRFLKVKLQSSNANTLLRSITLLDFLAENCGAMMKANIATPEFVNNNLLPIIDDSVIHISVKCSLVKEIYKLSRSFENDESLSIMKTTFDSLKTKYPELCNQVVAEFNGAAKPLSHTDPDEELELKKAIELSLKDASPRPAQPQQRPLQLPHPSQPPPQPAPQSLGQPPAQAPLHNPALDPTPALQAPQLCEDTSKPDKVVALYDLSSPDEDTLSFKKDDIITIVEEINADWLRGCLNGRAGIIPTNYVKKIPKTVDADLKKLIDALNSSFDIETTLSQLMDLNKKVKNSAMTSQQFESCLLSNNFPNKIQKIEQTKVNLKQILELHKLKLLELQSMQSNIDNSLKTYQTLITEMAPVPQDPEISNFIQSYPDISSSSLQPTQTGSVNSYIQGQNQPSNQNINSNMYNY